MKQKLYCFQCHRSRYTWTCKLSMNSPLRFEGDKCLYCLKRNTYLSKNSLINGCRFFLSESLENLLSGKWKPNNSHTK